MESAEDFSDSEMLNNIEAAHQHPSENSNAFNSRFENIGAVLQYRATAQPDQTFLIFCKDSVVIQSYTCLQLYNKALQIASFMRNRLQLRHGDRLATLLSNDSETALIYFAAWTAGLTVVPINRAEDDERAAYILKDSQAKALFTSPCDVERCRAAFSNNSPFQFILVGKEKQIDLSDNWLSLHDEIDRFPPHTILPEVPRNSECLIVYTSGTTGAPKGVVLEQQNLLADAASIAEWHRFDSHDRALCVLPIHHVNGIIVTLITPLLSGGSVVLSDKFHAGSFWKNLIQEQCSWVSVVPTILAMLCEKHDKSEMLIPPNFRHIICGAGPLTVEVASRFYEKFKIRIVHGYGLSETTCYSSFLPVELPEQEYAHWMFECGYPSIGCAISVNEMAIHNEDGIFQAENVRGEIVVRGSNVMRGYFNRHDANIEAFKHGWFRTGDEGFYLTGHDCRHYFFITGRIKELIIRGGVNYSPFDIDEVLCAIPGVSAALAVGFEHSIFGEEIGAYIIRAPESHIDESIVLEACAKKLPFAKCPKVVVFGDNLPVTSTGKYQRIKLQPYFSRWKDTQFYKS